MSKLLLDDLEEYGLQPVSLTPKKEVIGRIFGDSLPCLLTEPPDTIASEVARVNPEKLWVSHPTLPTLRGNKQAPLVKTERIRPKASFVMNFVLRKLKPPMDASEIRPPPSVGSYDLDKPLAYVMPKSKVPIILPERKSSKRVVVQERVRRPRRIVPQEDAPKWAGDNRYGEVEHNLNSELRRVKVNKRLVPIKESANTYVKTHSYYRTIDTEERHLHLKEIQGNLEEKFDEMKAKLRELKVSVRNCHVI